ncbi:hypothetical protein P0D88_03545 [Paraburkholderia sp. RL18-103-BIB-C]|uniref:hypothetical protein n=1 Tax=unclassified Paraburkholderia TaxID=2615204 RepID=UPI002F4E33B8
MRYPYQMKYMSPLAGGWNPNPLSSTETADDVLSMLSRLKEDASSLESYATELESELKRIQVERTVLGKKLRVLAELIKDVEALRAEPAAAQQMTVPAREANVEPVRPRSRLKCVLSVGLLAVVALATAFVVLERTGRIPSHITCAFIACNGHLRP